MERQGAVPLACVFLGPVVRRKSGVTDSGPAALLPSPPSESNSRYCAAYRPGCLAVEMHLLTAEERESTGSS